MRLDQQGGRDRGGRMHEAPMVPMINVVFLLLIFFMMAATLAPPDPVETVPPVSSSQDEAERIVTVHLAADGTLARENLRGEAVFGGLAEGVAVTVKADADAPAPRLAKVLARLRAEGAGEISLLVEAQ